MKHDPIKDKRVEELMGDLYLLQAEHENLYFDLLNGRDVKGKIRENESKQIPLIGLAIEYFDSNFPEHLAAQNQITILKKNLERLNKMI